MMADLFSSFDSGILNQYSFLMWFSQLALIVLIIAPNYNIFNFNILSISSLYNSTKDIKTTQLVSLRMFSFNLMFFLVMMNLFGLSPLTYSTSTNLWIILFMAICMWTMLIVSGWSFNIKGSIAHLSPNGAPLILLPFLVLIELVSMCIRPLTLTVRVIANISAGHVVLSLIASCLTACNFTSFTVVFFINVFYMMFEIFVCFIQAYIFSLLIKIYSEEHQ